MFFLWFSNSLNYKNFSFQYSNDNYLMNFNKENNFQLILLLIHKINENIH